MTLHTLPVQRQYKIFIFPNFRYAMLLITVWIPKLSTFSTY